MEGRLSVGVEAWEPYLRAMDSRRIRCYSECRCFKHKQMVVAKGLRSRDLPERTLGSWAGAAFASLAGVEMAVVKYRRVTVVWCGGPWLPHLLLAPVHSSEMATGLTQTEMKAVGRTWWKKSPPYLIREVCTSYPWLKPKPQLLVDVGKKVVCFPLH